MAVTYLTRSDVARLTELESTLRTLLDEARHEGNKYEDMPGCATCGTRHYGRPRGEQCALPDGFAEEDGRMAKDAPDAVSPGETDEAALRAEDEADIAERYSDLSGLERSIILAVRPIVACAEHEERSMAKAIAAITSSKAEPIVATIDGEPLTEAQVKARAAENRARRPNIGQAEEALAAAGTLVQAIFCGAHGHDVDLEGSDIRDLCNMIHDHLDDAKDALRAEDEE